MRLAEVNFDPDIPLCSMHMHEPMKLSSTITKIFSPDCEKTANYGYNSLVKTRLDYLMDGCGVVI